MFTLPSFPSRHYICGISQHQQKGSVEQVVQREAMYSEVSQYLIGYYNLHTAFILI